MTKKKVLEPSAFAASSGGAAAAAQPAKVSSLKKPSRSRILTSDTELPTTGEVAMSPEAQLESTSRTAKPKAPRAKSTAVTHRHKKLEIAPVAEMEPLRVESSPAPLVDVVAKPAKAVEPSAAKAVEPGNDEIAKLAYSYYVARGYQGGNQADDWFRAVSELRAKLNP